MHRGYFYAGRLFGVPLSFHWTSPILVVVMSGGAWYWPRWVASLFIILAHEYGHAFAARRAGALPTSIELHGLGGQCHYEGYVTPLWSVLIAWAGVAAQAVVLVAAIAVGAIAEPPESTPLGSVLLVLVLSNTLVIVLNLLPIPPLDGWTAWRIVPMAIRAGWRRMRQKSPPSRRGGPTLH